MNKSRTLVELENELLDQAMAGNSDAFGELVRMYQDRLFNSVMHIVRCRADAEDIVQDAFVQAYIKLDTFRRTSSFYTWLYRIAINFAVSRSRRTRKRLSVEMSREIAGTEPEDPGEAPGERMVRQEHAIEIRKALQSLSDEHRTILVMRGVDGMDYDNIALALDLNPGTVRSRLNRARTRLKEKLRIRDSSLV